MPVVADASPCPDGAFEQLMRTAFTERVVVLRSLTHDVEVQLPPGTPVPGTAELAAAQSAEPAEPAEDQRPWWFVPGVDDVPSERPAGPDRPDRQVVAVQQATSGLLDRTPTGAPANVQALFALAEQLRGLALEELAEMHATGSHLSTGAPTAATWLRQQRLISDVAARADVRLAVALRHELPGVGRLLRQGRTTLEHARAAVAGTRGLDVPVVQDSDPAICTLLGSADPPTVRAQLRERAEAVSPALGRETERRAHDRRGLTVDQIGTSGAVLGGALGVEDAEILLHALDLQTTADRADGDRRSLRQRRADVIV